MRVIVVGAGMMGLCTGMLLARDGHDVTLFERDPAPPPDPAAAWEDWERRGVNQFRLAHFFLSRFRQVAEAELPDLVKALEAAGGLRFNFPANIPDEMKGGSRPDDHRFDCITGRRSVVEAVTARTAEDTPGLTVRRGAAVASLLTGTPSRSGIPHVVGVTLEDGSTETADLVIDASGRRSPLGRWLVEAGAAPTRDEVDDSGFVYYGRHFRSPDGTLPVVFGPPNQPYGSISCLTLPADNGTWSVTITASSEDPALRAVTDPDKWAAVVRLLPLAAHWLDGCEAIDDRVAVMAKIEDRIRDIAPDGRPVATGVLNVADSWACTNPSLGRGASVGIVHAAALRDLLRSEATADPWELGTRWAAVTAEIVEPYYRQTLNYDRHRLAEIRAHIEGRPYETDDDQWHLIKGLEAMGFEDPDILRANLEVAMVMRTSDDVFTDADFRERVLEGGRRAAAEPHIGPTRQELLAVLG
jgi:2-polyprenyl-6-methoxyphenol hydroxylase-like FAD-dependent oxidoreductase